MPEKSETRPRLDFNAAAAKAGRISLELVGFKDRLERRKIELTPNMKRRVRWLSSQMIGLVEENLNGGLSLSQSRALNYASLGYQDSESAELQGIKADAVKFRRAGARKKLGAQTKCEATVKAIQAGIIEFTPDTNPDPYLTPMEHRILCNYALGRTGVGVAETYGTTIDSMASHRQTLRERLNARTMTHVMRRAFEVGIFKLGEEIPDPTREDIELTLSVDDSDVDLGAGDITRPDEIDLLIALKDLGPDIFSFDDIADSAFYENATYELRRNRFSLSMKSLMSKLERSVGEQVIEKRKARINGKYAAWFAIRKPLTIKTDEKIYYIPAYEGKIASDYQARLEEKRSKTQVRPSKASSIPKPKPKPALSVAPETVPAPRWDYLDHDSLPPIDEVMANLKWRKRTEVLQKNEVKAALDKLSRQEIFTDYRPRVVMSLRYGVPIPEHLPDMVRRNGQTLQLRELMKEAPNYVGLEVSSTSLLTGLTPRAVLETERQFIRSSVKNHPELAHLLPQIDKQIREIKN